MIDRNVRVEDVWDWEIDRQTATWNAFCRADCHVQVIDYVVDGLESVNATWNVFWREIWIGIGIVDVSWTGIGSWIVIGISASCEPGLFLPSP